MMMLLNMVQISSFEEILFYINKTATFGRASGPIITSHIGIFLLFLLFETVFFYSGAIILRLAICFHIVYRSFLLFVKFVISRLTCVCVCVCFLQMPLE